MNLEAEIQQIKERNQRVEADKGWETSWTRRIAIAILTYCVIVLFFIIARFPKPLLNALVPTVGFMLSTLSLSIVKQVWLKRWYKSGCKYKNAMSIQNWKNK